MRIAIMLALMLVNSRTVFAKEPGSPPNACKVCSELAQEGSAFGPSPTASHGLKTSRSNRSTEIANWGARAEGS
jgi:hypothetical protein